MKFASGFIRLNFIRLHFIRLKFYPSTLSGWNYILLTFIRLEFYPDASLDFIRIHFIRHALSGCLYFIRPYFTYTLLSDRSPNILSGRLGTICYSFTVRSRGEPKNHSKYLVSYHKVVGNDPPKPLKMLGFRPKAMGNDPPKLLKMLGFRPKS